MSIPVNLPSDGSKIYQVLRLLSESAITVGEAEKIIREEKISQSSSLFPGGIKEIEEARNN